MFKGALLHLSQATSGTALSALMAMDVRTEPYLGFPLDPQFAALRGRPTLTPGTTFVDPDNRFSIKTLSATAQALEVEVTMLGQDEGPRFSFGQPLDGALVSGKTPVTLVAAAGESFSRIEVTVDGGLLATRDVEGLQIYSLNWDTSTLSRGTHRIAATTYGRTGASTTRAVTVVVHDLPSVRVVAVNQSIALGQNISLLALTTTDSTTTSQQVKFFIDGPSGSQRLSGTAMPNGVYSLNWSPSERGTFNVSAEVEDGSGYRNWSTSGIPGTVSTIAIASQGVVSAANFRSIVSPGSLASIFGGGFTEILESAAAVPLPFTLRGVSVTIGGVSAPILFVSPSQINVQVPWSVEATCSASRQIAVSVRGANGTTEATVRCSLAVPAMFRLGAGPRVLATHADGTIIGPIGFVPGVLSTPAKTGETIVLWATGLGPVMPPARHGDTSADALRTTVSEPVVTIGGLAATVTCAGLAAGLVGVNQLNVVVPRDIDPNITVTLSVAIGGNADATGTIAIDQ